MRLPLMWPRHGRWQPHTPPRNAAARSLDVLRWWYGGMTWTGGKLLEWDKLLEEEWQTAFPGWPSTFCNVEGRCHPIPRPTLTLGRLSADGQFADYPDPQNVLSLVWTTQA